MAIAIQSQTTPMNATDAIWALIQTQAKSVQRDLAKRFAALDRAERKQKEINAYETTLSDEQKAWAHDIAESVKKGIHDVQLLDAGSLECPEEVFSPARYFIDELIKKPI